MPNEKILTEAYRTIEKLSNQLKTERTKIDSDRQGLLTAVAKDILKVLEPLLGEIAKNSKVNASDMQKALSEATVKVAVNQEPPIVNVNVPDVIVPDFPEIKVPTPIVNYFPPEIKIPEIKMPDEMNIKGWVSLMGVSLEKPLPVQLRNPDGSPMNLIDNLNVFGNSGGGSRGVVKISGYDASAWSNLGIINGDGRIRVETNDGTSSASTEVKQVSGAVDSVVVNDILAVSTVFPVSQVSGHNWSVTAFQGGTWDEVGINDSGNSITIDGSVSISGSIDSVVATGTTLHDAVDIGAAPVKIGGTAIQTNPSAVADGDIVRAIRDDLGRTITRPIHARDLINTAYVSVTSGTETTLLAASAGFYNDCIMIVGSNNSDAAVSVDIRAVTAGNILHTLRIPANGTAGWAPAVPWPQDATGNNWTVDGPDETGRTLTFSALFSKEV